LNSMKILGVNQILLLLLVATLLIIPPFAIDSRVTQNHEKRLMGVNKTSLPNRKLFLFHGLSTLGQQDIQFASVLSNDGLKPCVGRGQAETGSTAFLDDIHRLSCQSHRDLIPNALEPSIDLLSKNTSMSSGILLRSLAFPLRIYTIWMRRVVSGVAARKARLESTFIHAAHVRSTSTAVQILNLLLSSNVFQQMERSSGLDLSLKVSNTTLSGLKLIALSRMCYLLGENVIY
jgi:hypothetical protein